MDETFWEKIPRKNTAKHDDGCCGQCMSSPPAQPASIETQGKKNQRCCFDKSGRNPQLGGQIRARFWKHAHTFIGQGMQQVQSADNHVADSQHHECRGSFQAPGIPDKEKDTPCHRNRAQLNQGVKQKIVVPACDKQADNR